MCLLALPAAPWGQRIVILLSLTGDWKDFLLASLPASISPFLSLPTASLRFPKGTIMTGTEAVDRLSQEVRGAMETVLPMGTALQAKAKEADGMEKGTLLMG